VDLLLKFGQDLSFDFKMVRVKDGNWGGVVNGKWNGLVAALINHEADIVMTSVKINSGREKVKIKIRVKVKKPCSFSLLLVLYSHDDQT
jgi:hypothetical protein